MQDHYYPYDPARTREKLTGPTLRSDGSLRAVTARSDIFICDVEFVVPVVDDDVLWLPDSSFQYAN
jgi:hypothetical protein